jgi:hypothetical protein
MQRSSQYLSDRAAHARRGAGRVLKRARRAVVALGEAGDARRRAERARAAADRTIHVLKLPGRAERARGAANRVLREYEETEKEKQVDMAI